MVLLRRNRLRVSRADLKKPLVPYPGLRPAKREELVQANLAALRARVAKASEVSFAPRKKSAGRSLGIRGMAGTNFAEAQIKRIFGIAESNSPNKGFARAILDVWWSLRDSSADLSASMHRPLVSIARKIHAAERKKPRAQISLTPLERRTLLGYSHIKSVDALNL